MGATVSVGAIDATVAMGRHQNLNPDPKISLNHANLNLVNLWVVVSQEFHTQFQLLV